MKRSNLFLALTTGCLAVASIAFAKAHRFHKVTTGWCTSGSGSGLCTVATVKNLATVQPVGVNPYKCVSPNNRTAFTRDASLHTCKNVLYVGND